jgi:hypothetical protein
MNAHMPLGREMAFQSHHHSQQEGKEQWQSLHQEDEKNDLPPPICKNERKQTLLY